MIDTTNKEGNFQKCINLKRIDLDFHLFPHYIKDILSFNISSVNGLLYFL